MDTARGFISVIEGRATAARKDQRERLVACSDMGAKPKSHGGRVGEDHGKAVLTNEEVETIRDRFEAYPLGHPLHEGYRALAREFNTNRSTIRHLVNYTRRNTFPARWKRVTTD